MEEDILSEFESVSLTLESNNRKIKNDENETPLSDYVGHATHQTQNLTTKESIVPADHRYAEFFKSFENEEIID